jgi:hypothetical protein
MRGDIHVAAQRFQILLRYVPAASVPAPHTARGQSERGRRPLTWGADQGLRLVDSRERASHNATGVFAGPGEPSDCELSLQGAKSFTSV